MGALGRRPVQGPFSLNYLAHTATNSLLDEGAGRPGFKELEMRAVTCVHLSVGRLGAWRMEAYKSHTRLGSSPARLVHLSAGGARR
jgi:hypothetical protein